MMTRAATIPETRIRPAAVAGRFYPGDAGELREVVGALLAQAPAPDGPAPKAIIAPHAGYPFSGPVAASAYARLIPAREQIKRVVMFGPAHFVPVKGLAATSAAGLATPLGIVPVDAEAIGRLQSLPQVALRDEAHAREHSLEVHLPFLQTVLADFSVVPLVVGDATPDEVREVMELLWGGPETCIVVSSDLSHFYDSPTAQEKDRATAAAIEALAPSGIAKDQACGRISIQALLEAAQRRGLRARTLDLRNSGEIAGPRDRVVGYGAFAFEPEETHRAAVDPLGFDRVAPT
jgi:AmmeMemoRadiSam system protein B